jgi:CubicO group peptidase (beta-lactamase class C family)
MLAMTGCASLDRELAAMVDDRARPLASLSVLAVRGGDVVYQRQFGRRHIDPDLPVNEATLYRVASISKLVVTLGALRLVEDGKLGLDVDAGIRNPNFPDTPITLRMLLTHTSSMLDNGTYATAKPGTQFSYANPPWRTVAAVMEKATGERFDRLMKRLVVDPLGLSGGFNIAELPPERIANVATLYRKATAGDVQTWDPKGPWIVQADDYTTHAPEVPTSFAPQGGFRATAADLGRVMRMLMNGGELDGKRFLAKETIDTMISARLGNEHFADLVQAREFTAVGHHGNAYGLRSMLAFDPASKNGFIYLVGGTGFDPATDPGTYSKRPGFEERIATALYRRAILGDLAP